VLVSLQSFENSMSLIVPQLDRLISGATREYLPVWMISDVIDTTHVALHGLR
jgi:hypothetical protein